MALRSIKIKNPNAVNIIMGQSIDSHLLDVMNRALVGLHPELRYGLTFNEPFRQISTGTDMSLLALAQSNAKKIGVGDFFVLVVEHQIPVEILKTIKSVQAISDIYCATSKSVEIVVKESAGSKVVVGVVDDYKSREVN